ncbi:uncharacterized protein SPPG_00939 [Spizellomyces punctatus DAOM BR117]|uniref:SET domain-containing protein n=1 Tax=Spizellomyces punctatus (strain DAOM BR117) TaxID=645134 RepID=A0A0L0HPV0_SPIPD|nr:uncharacterized protein SPPG_00939 [Spizellomyces punctatus DAOM BR117]KND03456.1 hypothetical protein SPPG_00939 [Spizellomyces punctatus DAOM BR117]|eukprot:XP_016611495.1 hypothetical protein SPPG_00939 [Spizellomyces punctatus DAOM BR117]
MVSTTDSAVDPPQQTGAAPNERNSALEPRRNGDTGPREVSANASSTRMTRNRKLLAEGKEIRKPQYNVRQLANGHLSGGKIKEKPRWYNQTYIMFLALRQAGEPLPRGVLIPKALALDKEISRQRGLPPLFGGKTPQNTASGILTENRDKLFISFIPEGKKHVHFKLAYEPGNFETALEAYNKWMDALIHKDWPYLFSKRRKEWETTPINTDKSLGICRKNVTIESPAPSDVQDAALQINPPCDAERKRKREAEKENEQQSPKKHRTESSETKSVESGPSCTVDYFADVMNSVENAKARAVMEQSHALGHKDDDVALDAIFEAAEDDDIPTSLDQVVEVKESTIPNAGRGLFAKRFLPAWTFLGFYFGVPMTEDEFDSLKDGVGLASHYAHQYRLTVLDATDEKGQPYWNHPRIFCPFHFMNEDPKRANIVFKEGHQVNQVLCMTTREIQPGDELFANYGKSVERHWQTGEDLPSQATVDRDEGEGKSLGTNETDAVQTPATDSCQPSQPVFQPDTTLPTDISNIIATPVLSDSDDEHNPVKPGREISSQVPTGNAHWPSPEPTDLSSEIDV